MNRPVRVLHVLEATGGGTRRWLENVVRGMSKERVIHACICALRREPSFLDSVAEFENMGVKVWIVDMRRSISPLHDAVALRRIIRILKSRDFDVIHGHSSKGGMLARLAASAARGRPIVYSPHAFAFLDRTTPASRLYRLLEKMARPCTDHLLAVSESEARIAIEELRYAPSQVTAICNGIAVPNRPRDPCKPNSISRQIGMVAELRPQKDPAVFVKACALLHQRRKGLRFSLCGGGPLERRLRRQSARLGLDGVLRFEGLVPNPRPFLEQWEVFVISSRYEGLPYVILEAMAAGKPVVATRVPGIEDVVVNGKTGVLVPPGDANAMADAVACLLDDRDLAAHMGQAGYERVAARFRLDKQLWELAEFYERVARG